MDIGYSSRRTPDSVKASTRVQRKRDVGCTLFPKLPLIILLHMELQVRIEAILHFYTFFKVSCADFLLDFWFSRSWSIETLLIT